LTLVVLLEAHRWIPEEDPTPPHVRVGRGALGRDHRIADAG
jgi:hypothetical protein